MLSILSKSYRVFLMFVLLTLVAQCGVKIPPRPTHTQEGPLDRFEHTDEKDPDKDAQK